MRITQYIARVEQLRTTTLRQEEAPCRFYSTRPRPDTAASPSPVVEWGNPAGAMQSRQAASRQKVTRSVIGRMSRKEK